MSGIFSVTSKRELKIVSIQRNANEITSIQLHSIQNISFRRINCAIYSIAISCKKIMDDITTSKQENADTRNTRKTRKTRKNKKDFRP